uniref:Thioesterase-like family protein n=1 Tax=Parastrongyloides trichosuri TaxID=131310 RepID=A0A0N4Z9I0_PARTI
MDVNTILEENSVINYLLLDRSNKDNNIFISKNIIKNKSRASVFGGQLLSNSIFSAQKTIDTDFYCHSSHILFVNAVEVEETIIFKVERIRDSKNFSLRRVSCYHKDVLISDCSLSFHKIEEGSIIHQGIMPVIPKPEELKDHDYYVEEFMKNDSESFNLGQKVFFNYTTHFTPEYFCERRIYDPKIYLALEKSKRIPQHYYCWMRCKEILPKNPNIHRCFLALISDAGILEYAHKSHVAEGCVINFATSLEHSLYIHTPNINMNKWILLETVSPKAGNFIFTLSYLNLDGGRALTIGKFWSEDGIHLATIIQESLHRSKESRSKL